MKLVERFVCVPETGDEETGRASENEELGSSILDTPVFSVFGVRAYGDLEKFMRGFDI